MNRAECAAHRGYGLPRARALVERDVPSCRAGCGVRLVHVDGGQRRRRPAASARHSAYPILLGHVLASCALAGSPQRREALLWVSPTTVRETACRTCTTTPLPCSRLRSSARASSTRWSRAFAQGAECRSERRVARGCPGCVEWTVGCLSGGRITTRQSVSDGLEPVFAYRSMCPPFDGSTGSGPSACRDRGVTRSSTLAAGSAPRLAGMCTRRRSLMCRGSASSWMNEPDGGLRRTERGRLRWAHLADARRGRRLRVQPRARAPAPGGLPLSPARRSSRGPCSRPMSD